MPIHAIIPLLMLNFSYILFSRELTVVVIMACASKPEPQFITCLQINKSCEIQASPAEKGQLIPYSALLPSLESL
jgi:hypothetical protein